MLLAIVYVLLGGLAGLWLWLHFLTRQFKTDCIEGDPACPIREQRRIWNHIGWFSKSSDEKNYVRQHAPLLFFVNRTTGAVQQFAPETKEDQWWPILMREGRELWIVEPKSRKVTRYAMPEGK